MKTALKGFPVEGKANDTDRNQDFICKISNNLVDMVRDMNLGLSHEEDSLLREEYKVKLSKYMNRLSDISTYSKKKGVSRQTVYNWIESGKVQTVDIGGARFIMSTMFSCE